MEERAIKRIWKLNFEVVVNYGIPIAGEAIFV